jgi:hypothetical protein
MKAASSSCNIHASNPGLGSATQTVFVLALWDILINGGQFVARTVDDA